MTDLNVFILTGGTLEGELFANRITLQCSWNLADRSSNGRKRFHGRLSIV